MPDETKPPLLAAFGGNPPPAPEWFTRAVAAAPQRSTVAVAGADIEVLTWGDVGKPGLLLLHGGMAHADWWSFIAPFFADTHRVAALSWSGMGGSSWRTAYTIDQYVAEMQAVIEAAGLDRGPQKPMVLSHSFGGFPTMRAAHRIGAELGGVMILDAPVLSPAQRTQRAANRKGTDKPPRETRVYASVAEALTRFRFSPQQTCDNPFLVDWIARTSLRQITGPDGRPGWTWKFDPFMWQRLTRTDGTTDLASATCRVAMLWGGRSSLFPDDVIGYVRSVAPPNSLFIEIPEAAHHVMADQPLALVATVRSILAAWA